VSRIDELTTLLKAVSLLADQNPDFRRQLTEMLERKGEAAKGGEAPEDAPALKSRGASRTSAPRPLRLDALRVLREEGEDALARKLRGYSLAELRAYVAERNLDAAGKTDAMAKPALIAHIIVAVDRKHKRDQKLFG
jgi:hypothetical protein